MTPRVVLGLALAPAGLLAVPAHASVLDIYGFNPRGTAMGNAQTAVADDYTAAFYNPAALTRRKQIDVGAGFIATFPHLNIDRSDPLSTVPSELPPSFAGFNIGAMFPLGGLIENRVALGIAAYLPTLNLLRAEGVDAQIPQFYLYQNLPDKYDLVAAAAFEFGPYLSVGAGVQVLATLDGAVDLHIDLQNRVVEQRSVDVKVSPKAAPTAGVFSHPIPPLTLGASWRGALKLDFGLPVLIDVKELVDLNIDIGGTVLYSPHVFNLGAAWNFDGPALLVTAEASYALWSRAPDPSPRFDIDVGGALVEGIGLGDRLDVRNGAASNPGFRDTLTLRAGVEQKPFDFMTLRAGYAYRQSPAPVPTEAFNYVDCDAHLLSVGAGFSFHDPLEIRENAIHVELAYQATLLQTVSAHKVLGDRDPVGDFKARGRIDSLGIAFLHDL